MSEWKTVRVSDIAARGANSLATGPFGSSISSKFFRRSGVPVIRGGNLSSDSEIRLNDNDLVFLDPEKAREFTRSVVRNGDLIFTSWGTINQIGLVDQSATHVEYVISNKQMKLTPNPDIAVSEFLYYLFSGPDLQREILEGAIGSSIPGFNLTRLRSIELHLPRIEEQSYIASALSDAEQLGGALAKQIAKKQAIKQGMMQQLLTEETRLPGFTTPWQETNLEEVARFSKGSGLPKSALTPDGADPCVHYGELFTHYGPEIEAVSSRTSAAKGAVRSEDLDVLMPTSDVTPRGLAKASSLHGSGIVLGGDILIIRPDKSVVHGPFLAHVIRRDENQVLQLVRGSTVYHLYASDMKNFVLRLPTVEEQRAIAQILLDADDEIQALQTRLTKARNIKTGIMQQLLSGRIRLPVDSAS